MGQGDTAPSILVMKSRKAPPVFVTKGIGSKILTGAALAAAPFTGGASLAAKTAATAAAKKIAGSKLGQGIASKFGKVAAKKPSGEWGTDGLAGKLIPTSESLSPTQTQLPSTSSPVSVAPPPPVAAPASALDDVWAGQNPAPPSPTTTPPPPKLENPATVGTSMADASSSKGVAQTSVSEQPNVFDTALNERGSIKPVDAPKKDWSQGFESSRGEATGTPPMKVTGNTLEGARNRTQSTLESTDPTLQAAELETLASKKDIKDANTYNIPLIGEVDKDKAQWAAGAAYVGNQARIQGNQAQQAKIQADQQQIQQLTEQARSKAGTGGGQVAVTA